MAAGNGGYLYGYGSLQKSIIFVDLSDEEEKHGCHVLWGPNIHPMGSTEGKGDILAHIHLHG